VPARNEDERLPILLDALAVQTVVGRVPVALCINNSTDGTAAAAASASTRHTGRLELHIEECAFPPPQANAGSARGRAMEIGYAAIDGSGLLISTDADCRPPVNWIAANLASYAAGTTIVGGRIALDDAEPLAPVITEMRNRFDAYWSAVRDIEDRIDPSFDDPAPRHGDHTGASLAIDAALFRAVGGVRPVPTGEDRALVIAALAAGGRLSHPAAVWTRVSARMEGRAAGGMAAAMAELADTLDRGLEPMVPAYDHWIARARWRRTERSAFGVARMLSREEALPPMPADMPLPTVGE
jgi:hypothetical protein